MVIKQAYHALISPQGHIEYNAKFVLGSAVEKLKDGQWYTNQQLADIAGGINLLRDSSGAIEKNVKKWRYEIQP